MRRVAWGLLCVLACHRGGPPVGSRLSASKPPSRAVASGPHVRKLLTAPPCATIDACADILASSTDRNALEGAGVWLAMQGDAASVAVLGKHLAQAEFLARLDEPDASGPGMRHFSPIFAALAPTEEVAALCRTLAVHREYTEHPWRTQFLLAAAARAKPMTEETAAFFASVDQEAFANATSRMLARNGSPRALALLERMLGDRTFTLEERVETIHHGLLPVRTDEGVLRMVTRMLARRQLISVEVALVETMFDHRGAEWFGKRMYPPSPPPWTAATTPALEAALELAARVRRRATLPAELRRQVAATAKEIETVLGTR